MLTAYLRPDLFDESHAASPEEQARLRDYASNFSAAFEPFSASPSNDEKLAHLVAVLRTASKTALWLFAQPAVFEFDWSPTPDVRDRSARALVIVPSLWKICDANGSRLARSQKILAGVTART